MKSHLALEKLQFGHSPSTHSTAKHNLWNILPLRLEQCQAGLHWQSVTNTQHTHVHTHTRYCTQLSAVYVTVRCFPPPPPHTLLAVAGLKRGGWTGDVETDGCWQGLKTWSLTLMGLKRDREEHFHLGLIVLNQPAAKHKFRKRQ